MAYVHFDKFIDLAINILFIQCCHGKLKLSYRILVSDLELEPRAGTRAATLYTAPAPARNFGSWQP
jgi:hypothetical protein